MSIQGYLLALEGGGTRCQAALLDPEGKVLKTGESSDVNTNFVAYEQAQQAVLSAVREVIHAAGVNRREVSHFVAALVRPDFGAETFGELCPNAVTNITAKKM